MEEYEFAVVGAGPAGLCGAIEAARAGIKKVVVVDESFKAGGQLIKQTHKFFGGKEHGARERGVDIASRLAGQCDNLGINLLLDTAVWAIFHNSDLALYRKDKDVVQQIKAKKILLATGASENPLAFPGWTLPGVLGAGAIQTMVNVHRVVIGSKVLMIGSGNVGLIVSYQLMQAGAKVVAVVDILPRIGGYWVHASKIARLSVPILTSHVVKEVRGNGKVEAATIVKVDSNRNPIPGTEQDFEVDAVCIAVGLSPLAELAWMCGCQFMNVTELGGWVPIHDQKMETTVPGIYVAGDVAGIEEASTAMLEGALAGLAAAESLGYLSPERSEELKKAKMEGLQMFREGLFESRKIGKEKLHKGNGVRQ